MNILVKAAVVALVALSGGSALAQTTTVNFTYSGQSSGGFNVSVGSGSFSFPSSLTAAGISDLTAFSFTTSRDSPGLGFTSTYTYGLSDLSAFGVQLTPSGDINSLSIRTNVLEAASISSGSPSGSPVMAFATAGWTTGTNSGAGQLEWLNIFGSSVVTSGTVTVTSIVPAPGAAALLGVGGLLVARRRRA